MHNFDLMTGEAQIFLADQRGRTESSAFRSLHTFNFGKFQEDHRKPFLHLDALNDETLNGGQSTKHMFAEKCQVFILPLVGGVNYKINEEDCAFIEAGQCAFFFLNMEETLEIQNPYEVELVNYLLLVFAVGSQNSSNTKIQFDLDEMNSLQQLVSNETISIYIGKFGGRVDSEFISAPGSRGVFAFVIEGAFEFDNRLIQQRDGLALSTTAKIEYESLSKEAIVLVVELGTSY